MNIRYLLKFIYLSMILFLAVIWSFAQSIEDILRKENTQPGYMFLHYRQGNFTGSGLKEFVAFYNDIEEYEQLKKDQFYIKHPEKLKRDISKIVVYIVSNNNIIRQFDINMGSGFPYGDEESQLITNIKIGLTGWDGYCYVADLNKDNLDDIIFFEGTGMGIYLHIYQFDRNKNTMEDSLYGLKLPTIRKMEVRQDGGRYIIRLFNYYEETVSTGHYQWHDYTWNEKSEKYELVNEGSMKKLDEKISSSSVNTISKSVNSIQFEQLHNEGYTLYKQHKDAEAVLKYEEGLRYGESAELWYDFGNSLSNLKDRLEDSLKAYKKSVDLGFNKKYFAIYNMACVYSKLGKLKEAYYNLTLAVKAGYNNFKQIEKDPDLQNLRTDKDWPQYLSDIKSGKLDEWLEKTKI